MDWSLIIGVLTIGGLVLIAGSWIVMLLSPSYWRERRIRRALKSIGPGSVFDIFEREIARLDDDLEGVPLTAQQRSQSGLVLYLSYCTLAGWGLATQEGVTAVAKATQQREKGKGSLIGNRFLPLFTHTLKHTGDDNEVRLFYEWLKTNA